MGGGAGGQQLNIHKWGILNPQALQFRGPLFNLEVNVYLPE
jgi:hypothetical protein